MESAIEFLIDISGSMKGAKIEHARKVLLDHILPSLDFSCKIGIKIFTTGNNGLQIIQLAPLGITDRQTLTKVFSEVKAVEKGGTPISAAIRQSVNTLKEFASNKKSIVLVTDGEEDQGGNYQDECKRAQEEGVKCEIHIIGIGLKPTSIQKAKEIASLTGGSASILPFLETPAAKQPSPASALTPFFAATGWLQPGYPCINIATSSTTPPSLPNIAHVASPLKATLPAVQTPNNHVAQNAQPANSTTSNSNPGTENNQSLGPDAVDALFQAIREIKDEIKELREKKNPIPIDDIEGVIAASRARTAAEKELKEQQQGQPKTNRHQKHYQVRKGKRTRIHALEQVVTEVDYPGDKAGLKPMGKKVVVVYDYVPGKIIKSETHFLKYIDTEGHIFKALIPPRVIERGTVSNRLVAQMHTEKFVYYSPYYRQLQRLRRLGIVFSASTVNDWEEICYKKLKRLLKLMKRIINQQDYLQIDEVPINYVNDVGKGHCSRGYFWVVNAPRQKLVFFQFNEGRSNEVPKELLKDFKGKLQCDGLSAYKTAFKDSQVVTLVTCLVHIRRDFFKALKNNKALAEYFFNETRIVYDLEAYADKKQLADEARADMRKKHVKPILDQLKGWLLQHQSAIPPDSPISKAVNYALNHWHMLDVYIEDGKLLPDNNGVERAIRPVTLYRKNSLFAGNEHGAERAALFFSLLETCRLHDLDPFEYLCDVYERIHDCPAHQLEELLPHKWKKSL